MICIASIWVPMNPFDFLNYMFKIHWSKESSMCRKKCVSLRNGGILSIATASFHLRFIALTANIPFGFLDRFISAKNAEIHFHTSLGRFVIEVM